MRETGSLEDTARLLGHASIETTRIGATWGDEGLRTPRRRRRKGAARR